MTGVARIVSDRGPRHRRPTVTSREVVDELVRTTVRRLFYVALVAIPVSAGHLAVFWRAGTDTPAEARWRTGILLAHAVLALSMVGILAASARLRHRDRATTGMRVLIGSGLAVTLLAGALIATIDQWVTTAITPFLVACTIAGLVFLVRPRWAIGAYLAGFTVFAIGMGATQDDPAVVLSNRVNALTAAAIGFGLTLILWNKERSNVVLRRRIEQQQRELEHSNRRLAELAASDELTGLVNRRQFQLLLGNELERMRREGYRSSLLILDIDDFKPVNDVHGHPAGDELLRQVADRLRSRLRASDIVARWGGEEFLVLLPGADVHQARRVAEEQRTRLAADAFDLGTAEVSITVSIGVAALDVDADEPLEEAYRRVDAALYRAKELGKDRVVLAGT